MTTKEREQKIYDIWQELSKEQIEFLRTNILRLKDCPEWAKECFMLAENSSTLGSSTKDFLFKSTTGLCYEFYYRLDKLYVPQKPEPEISEEEMERLLRSDDKVLFKDMPKAVQDEMKKRNNGLSEDECNVEFYSKIKKKWITEGEGYCFNFSIERLAYRLRKPHEYVPEGYEFVTDEERVTCLKCERILLINKAWKTWIPHVYRTLFSKDNNLIYAKPKGMALPLIEKPEPEEEWVTMWQDDKTRLQKLVDINQ